MKHFMRTSSDGFAAPLKSCSLTHIDQVLVVALLALSTPGTHSLLALILLTAHAKNVLVGTEEMEKP